VSLGGRPQFDDEDRVGVVGADSDLVEQAARGLQRAAAARQVGDQLVAPAGNDTQGSDVRECHDGTV